MEVDIETITKIKPSHKEMNEKVQTVLTVIASLGGLEFIKWLFNRKHNSRIAEAEANAAEVKADTDEFHLLRERLELADRQLLEKEERFHEQTILMRELNKQLLEKAMKIGELEAKISALEAERKMKLCERRGCAERMPQSGY